MYRKRLLKRFVDILAYEHLEDLIIEVLHILVLITNLKEPQLINELVNEGIILGLNKFIETSLQTKTGKLATQLTLQTIANCTEINSNARSQLKGKESDEENERFSIIERMARLGKNVGGPVQRIPSPQLILETDYSAVQKTDPSALQKSEPENASVIQSSDQGATGT